MCKTVNPLPDQGFNITFHVRSRRVNKGRCIQYVLSCHGNVTNFTIWLIDM